MGGFRLAMQAHGGKCVFSSEWNKFAQRTYFANFGEVPFGDITKEYVKGYIPEKFDVLCAGFPCQPFSIAGVSKRIVLDVRQDSRIRPKVRCFLMWLKLYHVIDQRLFLENVKNLVSHDKGNTFAVIKGTLEELNYTLHYLVMDGQDYVPQHRERIIMVGFDKSVFHGQEDFQFPLWVEEITL